MSHHQLETEPQIAEVKKPRTTAQKWARLEKINENIAELMAEKVEIVTSLREAVSSVA